MDGRTGRRGATQCGLLGTGREAYKVTSNSYDQRIGPSLVTATCLWFRVTSVQLRAGAAEQLQVQRPLNEFIAAWETEASCKMIRKGWAAASRKSARVDRN